MRPVGLVGSGAIGRAVIRRLSAFGSSVIVHDPYLDTAPEGCELVDLETLLARSDVLTVHAPTDRRHPWLDRCRSVRRDEARRVRRQRFTRGGIIDDERTCQTRFARAISPGAGLDTFGREPIGESPLRELPTVIMSPHIAWVESSDDRRHDAKGDSGCPSMYWRGTLPEGAVNPEALHLKA